MQYKKIIKQSTWQDTSKYNRANVTDKEDKFSHLPTINEL